MIKTIIIFILIFFTWILTTNAATQQNLIKYFKENDKISVKNTDLSYCSWQQKKWIFALPTWIKYPYTNAEIDILEKELSNIIVDKKSKTSVDNYNNKLDKIYGMVDANNNTMKKVWIPVAEYCKPYNCNKDFPWTVYEKSTDKCICNDWKDFDKSKNKCPIKEILPPAVRQNIDIKDNLDIQKDNLILWIIGILLWIVILYVAFKD